MLKTYKKYLMYLLEFYMFAWLLYKSDEVVKFNTMHNDTWKVTHKHVHSTYSIIISML